MTCNIRNTTRAIVAAAVVWSVLTSATIACPVCVLDGRGFKLPHARALVVAVAVVAAHDDGFLFVDDPSTHQRPIEFELHRFADAVFGPAGVRSATDTGGFDIILVDQAAHYQIGRLPGSNAVSQQISARHRRASALLLTATPVIRAISRGELTVAMAINSGILEVDDVPSERAFQQD
jgi:hypothetical protein